VGRCTVIVTDYGSLGPDGLLEEPGAWCVMKKGVLKVQPQEAAAGDSANAPALAQLFEKLSVPAGAVQAGQVLSHMCQPAGHDGRASSATAAGDHVPLLNEQVGMEDREVISEPLFSGIPVRACSEQQATSPAAVCTTSNKTINACEPTRAAPTRRPCAKLAAPLRLRCGCPCMLGGAGAL
jgi:hypothetical protein